MFVLGIEIYELKKNIVIFQKDKGIAQIYDPQPQSAGINMQSPQSESTSRRLTLGQAFSIFPFLP